MKQSQLRTDPEKTKAFQERGRKPLGRDPEKALKRKGPLGPAREVAQALARESGREGMRSTALRRSSASAEERRRSIVEPSLAKQRTPAPAAPQELTMAKALKTRFAAREPAAGYDCVMCPPPVARPGKPPPRLRRGRSWHHWLAQEHLRVYVRSVAKATGLEPREARRRLRLWLRDERNLSAMCHRCHMQHEHSVTTSWSRADVPPSAWEFAAEVDDELEAVGVRRQAVARLLHDYPEAPDAG